jgi:hypothetical protein
MTGDGSRAPGGNPSPAGSADAPDVAVLRRTPAGWSVGEEDAGDLTCAMVLADLIAAELPDSAAEASDYLGTIGDAAASGGPAGRDTAAGTGAAGTGAAGRPAAADPAAPSDQAGDEGSPDETRRLRATVRQLERALAVRIRVEQAIGILAERHRVRPRQAFEQLRAAARGRGQRVIDIAGDVVASATNPLLPLPEELSRPTMAARPRSRSQRRARGDQ